MAEPDGITHSPDGLLNSEDTPTSAKPVSFANPERSQYPQKIEHLIWCITNLQQTVNSPQGQVTTLQSTTTTMATTIKNLNNRTHTGPPKNNTNNNKTNKTYNNKQQQQTPKSDNHRNQRHSKKATKTSYAAAAAVENNKGATADVNFTKITNKKQPKTGFHPEFPRLSRQFIVETEGPLPEVTDDQILQVVDNATETQGLRFQCVTRSSKGNLHFKTNLQTSANEGTALHIEIILVLDILSIQVTSVYANSRWSQFVVQDVPASISTKNCAKLATIIADEIQRSTYLSLAQPSHWFTCPEVLKERGRGTIIISLSGNVQIEGVESLAIFNRSCRIVKARPEL